MTLVVPLGCAEVSKVVGSTWHEKCGWKVEDYFDDPQVIALCHAIEDENIAEIDRLVAAGADVNAQGKGKMTPLLWAFPDNKLDRFERLLEHGADPNVIIESDFNSRGAMRAGDSVTHMASKTTFPGYFEAVFENGGNVNLVNGGKGNIIETPIFKVIKFGAPGRKEKVQLLIDKGADIDYMNGAGATPPMQAVSWGGQYDIALNLLEAGASYRVYQGNQVQRLVHVVVRQERRLPEHTPQQKADYQRLVRWLEDHGESIEEARADIKRWDSWSRTTGEYRRKMDAEIAAREAREKKAAEKDRPEQ